MSRGAISRYATVLGPGGELRLGKRPLSMIWALLALGLVATSLAPPLLWQAAEGAGLQRAGFASAGLLFLVCGLLLLVLTPLHYRRLNRLCREGELWWLPLERSDKLRRGVRFTLGWHDGQTIQGVLSRGQVPHRRARQILALRHPGSGEVLIIAKGGYPLERLPRSPYSND